MIQSQHQTFIKENNMKNITIKKAIIMAVTLGIIVSIAITMTSQKRESLTGYYVAENDKYTWIMLTEATLIKIRMGTTEHYPEGNREWHKYEREGDVLLVKTSASTYLTIVIELNGNLTLPALLSRDNDITFIKQR